MWFSSYIRFSQPAATLPLDAPPMQGPLEPISTMREYYLA
jgi:hypothetical protein